MSSSDDECKNPYLQKLMETISGLRHVDGECVMLDEDEYFFSCLEIEIPYNGNPQRVLVEISVTVDSKITREAHFTGKLFALSTDDPEVFIENVLTLFSKTIEIFELFGWIISVPSGLSMNNLSENEVFLSISRTENLNPDSESDIPRFANSFSDAILDIDLLMNYLVEML